MTDWNEHHQKERSEPYQGGTKRIAGDTKVCQMELNVPVLLLITK